ncbi:hypothetical protein RBSH_02782 [Rhodopirellula baltica SH28]|uniref:Uncharacterized protein n=1 Tax=Rhodopirellula baltica SH28 TaxID=993517 RepID=K5E804_RHOBT|nr:hypothetical protein RBSH_02782 [Rhodopirellula baltica SH28]
MLSIHDRTLFIVKTGPNGRRLSWLAHVAERIQRLSVRLAGRRLMETKN